MAIRGSPATPKAQTKKYIYIRWPLGVAEPPPIGKNIYIYIVGPPQARKGGPATPHGVSGYPCFFIILIFIYF
jgi:hypothetical protein